MSSRVAESIFFATNIISSYLSTTTASLLIWWYIYISNNVKMCIILKTYCVWYPRLPKSTFQAVPCDQFRNDAIIAPIFTKHLPLSQIMCNPIILKYSNSPIVLKIISTIQSYCTGTCNSKIQGGSSLQNFYQQMLIFIDIIYLHDYACMYLSHVYCKYYIIKFLGLANLSIYIPKQLLKLFP